MERIAVCVVYSSRLRINKLIMRISVVHLLYNRAGANI